MISICCIHGYVPTSTSCKENNNSPPISHPLRKNGKSILLLGFTSKLSLKVLKPKPFGPNPKPAHQRPTSNNSHKTTKEHPTLSPKPKSHLPFLTCSKILAMNHILLRSPTLPPKTHIIRASTPPTDRVIDFGKHKGRMLGTLPSTYLKWVSKNLRAGDSEQWAKLADQVLHHPLYQDRLEWEQAERLLTGNDAASRRVENPAEELAHLSETFGWDNGDKVGWSRVDFGLLGTSKTGRIPRVGAERGSGEVAEREKNEGSGGGGRERLRMKRRIGIVDNTEGNFGNTGKDADDEDRTVENRHRPHSPFPGRQALLKKVLERKKFL